MYLKIEKKILKTIEKNELIKKGDIVVIGFSGGADSCALFHFLYKFKNILDIKIYTIHINHKLRGVDANKDSEFVYNMSKDLAIECKIIDSDIRAYGKKYKISIEEAGREVRYTEFKKYINEIGGNKIATAHHKDDNIETILMNINRGCGMKGLSGIPYRRDNIIRPLLDIEKGEILDYLKDENIKYRVDVSNLENEYMRNKIRNILIPSIENEIGKNFLDNIDKMSKLISEEDSFLDQVALETYKRVILKETDNNLVFNKSELQKINITVLRRVLRYSIYKIKSNLKNIESIHIDVMMEILYNNETGKKAQLPGGLVCENIYDTYLIFKGIYKYEKLNNYIIEKSIIKDLNIFEEIKNNKSENLCQYFDNELVKNQIEIRERMDGDVFYPLGLGGKKKLKDFLIDKKVPRLEREKIRLLVSGEDILWIFGFGISDKYKVTEKTKEILKINIKS